MAEDKKDAKPENLSIFMDMLREVHSDVKKMKDSMSSLDTEFKLHKQESENRWDEIKKLDEEQNALLAEHSARSRAIQKDVELRDRALRRDVLAEGVSSPKERKGTVIGRVENLEMPMKFGKWLLGVIATVLAVAKLIDLIL